MTTFEDYFPFRKLGLRSNPFRVLTDDEWADVAVVPEAIESAFNAGDHLLILGKRGRGKSTALRTLIRRLYWQQMTVAYERLPFGSWGYQTDINTLDAFAPDEAQRLAVWEWPALLRRVNDGMRLIMGSHRNDKWVFNLNGIPIRVFHLKHYNTREHLKRVLQRRLAYFTYDELRVSFDASAVDFLWQTYGDDLRAIETVLYYLFEALDVPQPITADLIRCRL